MVMTDQEFTERGIDEEQALGYLLLACEQIGYSLEQVQQIGSSMNLQFNKHSPEVAKKEGEKWFSSIKNSPRHNDYGNLMNERPKPKYKRANVKIPTIVESEHSRELRHKNERIVRELSRMQNGPFGLYAFFGKCEK